MFFAFTSVACSTFNVNEKVASSAGFNTIYWQINRGLLFWPTLYIQHFAIPHFTRTPRVPCQPGVQLGLPWRCVTF